MSSFLVIYASDDGQTASIADRIGTVLGDRGHTGTTHDVRELPSKFSLAEFDAVIVGASIHVGKHQTEIRSFVTEHREELNAKPTAFFQVSLSSATPEGQAEAAGYVVEFVDGTGWHPDRIGQFGGALRFSKYGFLKRLMMKQIAKRQLPDVDTSEDVEFTDWGDVEAFTNDVAAFVESRLGVTPIDLGEPE